MSLFKEKQYLRVQMDKAPDDSLWMKCKSCGELVFKKRVRENNNICPDCGDYFFLTAAERIESLLDDGVYENLSQPIAASDPLGFVDSRSYAERIEEAQEKTGMTDAIIVARGAIDGHPVVLAVMDFRFVGGGMGLGMGGQICHAMETAVEDRCPFILISSSGGARLQEGLFSLMQMAKTATVRKQLAEHGVPFISVMTYPTSGGVQASIASLGDITIAERGAMIGFAGRRVIQNTIAQELPAHYQTDAFALEHGAIDRVVKREELRDELIAVLGFFVGVR